MAAWGEPVPDVTLNGVRLGDLIGVTVDMQAPTVLDVTQFGDPVPRFMSVGGFSAMRISLTGRGEVPSQVSLLGVPQEVVVTIGGLQAWRSMVFVDGYQREVDSGVRLCWRAELVSTGEVARAPAGVAWDVPGVEEGGEMGRRVELGEGPPSVLDSIPEDFSIAMLHDVGVASASCGGVALYRRPGRYLVSADARYPDGSRPPRNSVLRCGSCGRNVTPAQLRSAPRRPPTTSVRSGLRYGLRPEPALLDNPGFVTWPALEDPPRSITGVRKEGYQTPDGRQVVQGGELVERWEAVDRKVEL